MSNLRVYGRWGGNPKGTPEDVTRCIASVYPAGRAPIQYQCSRPRGHGDGGLYCKTHDPKEVRRKRAEAYTEYLAKFERKMAPNRLVPLVRKLLDGGLTDGLRCQMAAIIAIIDGEGKK